MVKEKFHKTIASFLLGCILVIGLPFHDFLHQHTHCHENSTETTTDTQLCGLENAVNIHDCIACTLSQAARTFFVKSTILSLQLFVEKLISQGILPIESYFFALTPSGRGPPSDLI